MTIVTCVYFGNIESKTNYNKLCKPTIGNITKILLEENRNTRPSNITYGITGYSDKILFRLKIVYEYTVNNNVYHGYFYNDGKNTQYDEYEKIKSYWNYHKANKYVKIYYLQHNNKISNIMISNIQSKHINFYYKWGTILFVLFVTLVLIDNMSNFENILNTCNIFNFL